MEQPAVKKILYTNDQIQARVSELGRQISSDYEGKELILVSVLKGSLYFIADLSRAITTPIKIDMISIGVYSTTDQTGIVKISKDLDLDIKDKHVLIIEDTIRTGLTIGYLVQNLQTRQPKSVKVCSLLVNPMQQLIELPIAYTGFITSAEQVAGYGADIKDKWRNLPFIAEI